MLWCGSACCCLRLQQYTTPRTTAQHSLSPLDCCGGPLNSPPGPSCAWWRPTASGQLPWPGPRSAGRRRPRSRRSCGTGRYSSAQSHRLAWAAGAATPEQPMRCGSTGRCAPPFPPTPLAATTPNTGPPARAVLSGVPALVGGVLGTGPAAPGAPQPPLPPTGGAVGGLQGAGGRAGRERHGAYDESRW